MRKLSILDTKPYPPGYWKRLKEHPGWTWVVIFTLLGAMAGAKNENHPEFAALIIGGAMLVIFGGMVLLSNFSRD